MTAQVTFESLEVGQQIPELAKVVDREDVVRYADVSTDRNPLHLDDEFASNHGFPGMIAHGMFTMAHLMTCLTDWLGDPGALCSTRAFFRSAVTMGDTIVAGGSVKSLDPKNRQATLEIWVRIDPPTSPPTSASNPDASSNGRSDFAIRRSSATVQLG